MNSTQNMPEIWKPVVGYEGPYEVSDRGKVRSLDRTVIYKTGQTRHFKGQPLKLKPHHGYWRVELNRNGKCACFRVHRLVLAAFVGPLPEGKEVCHNNGNPGDNRLENLRYGTKSENQRDRIKHGTHHELNKTHCPRGHRLADPNLRADKNARGSGHASHAGAQMRTSHTEKNLNRSKNRSPTVTTRKSSTTPTPTIPPAHTSPSPGRTNPWPAHSHSTTRTNQTKKN